MSTTSAQAYAEVVSDIKINYSHVSDSGRTHETYYLHMPGTLTGWAYSNAVKAKPVSSSARHKLTRG